MPPDVGVVIVAAGRGERIGSGTPKQFLPIAGVPLLLHALRPFVSHPGIADVVVVLPPGQAAAPPEWLGALLGSRLHAVDGGATRMDSVEAGLHALPSACRIVLVHDGARPFPDAGVIGQIIAEARKGRGAIAALALSDTLKEAAPGTSGVPPRVLRTVPRESLWRAQTPQGFPRGMLEGAYAAARADGVVATDCAALVERSGGEVVLVADLSSNFKVTTRADLLMAEAIAGREP